MIPKTHALVVLVLVLGTACVSPPSRYEGHYERADQVYVNDTVGFRLSIPQYWAVTTKRRDFTVPLALRPDQEQVLEAYDATSRLGLVIVVQHGPLASITELVQRMQAVSPEQVAQRLQSPHTTGVRQTLIRRIVVNGHEAVEWIYTVTDTTAGTAVDMTVSSYILKISDHYVYLTFSAPLTHATSASTAIQSVLHTFDLSSSI